jgi:GNAT superfamily N-acetyltransferase
VDDVAERARAWHHAAHSVVCDVFEPWAYGTIVSATRWPTYFDFNSIRVEEDPDMPAEALVTFADEIQAGHGHRRFDWEDIDSANRVRPAFDERGWETYPEVWMLHRGPLPPRPEVPIEEVSQEAVDDLRTAWHEEDFPGVDMGHHLREQREVSRLLGARVLAVLESGRAVAFAQLERIGDSAEVAQVYVRPDRRGRGLGTAVTCAAVEAGSDATDLWIVADDEGRPKRLYGRLGFRPAWTAMQIMLLPRQPSFGV